MYEYVCDKSLFSCKKNNNNIRLELRGKAVAVSTQVFARIDKSLAVKVCVLLLGEKIGLFYFNWFNARIVRKPVNNVIDYVQCRAESLKKKNPKKPQTAKN